MDMPDSQKTQNTGSAVLSEIADLIRRTLPLEWESGSAEEFELARARAPEGSAKPGIQRIHGALENQGAIRLRVDLLKTQPDVRLSACTLFKHLSSLGEKIRVAPPVNDGEGGWVSLCLELVIQATPMSLARSGTLLQELNKLEKLAGELQAELPEAPSDSDLTQRYADVADILEPVYPVRARPSGSPEDHRAWAVQTVDYLNGSLPVAIVTADAVTEGYCLGLMADACAKLGTSLGRLAVPAVNAKSLVEISKKAPGIVVVPASRISLGTNIYDLGNEIFSFLETVPSLDSPFAFTGTQEQLQMVFHGGQGGSRSPQMPVVRHAPEISLEILASFAVELSSRRVRGLSASDKAAVAEQIIGNLSSLPVPTARRVLPSVARREVSLRMQSNRGEFPSTRTYVSGVASLTETLSGIAVTHRGSRPQHIQEELVRTLAGGELLPYLKQHLFAQDRALEALALRLRTESLTRPDHQPIRYCAQGMPATGKSQSAVLIARRLGVPYVNIDAASMPDYYTAAAQLLGSGRGIVGSHKSGRLEEAARHHTGALVEVSDLDHAVPQVRAALADLFLQVLETGEAQSAAGVLFSCANLIFAFTVNLPNGRDESIYKSIGFGKAGSGKELRGRVTREFKDIFSSAFLSRIGDPILFEPLTGEAMTHIVTGAAVQTLRTAAARLRLEVPEISVEEGVAPLILESMGDYGKSPGARTLIEHARNLVATALQDYLAARKGRAKGRLRLRPAEEEYRLIIGGDD